MNKASKLICSSTAAILLALNLAGCGASAEDQAAAQVATICAEANLAMSAVSSTQIIPDPNGDWSEIQTFYSDLADQLQNLSGQASELQETQLARDFSSVGKGAGKLEAVASLITTVGYGTTTVQLEWLDAVNEFTENEALRAPNDRTFIGCN